MIPFFSSNVLSYPNCKIKLNFKTASKALEKRFDDIVMRGIEENPTSLNPEKKGKCGISPKTKARNLLDRFTEHKEKILRFLIDL